MRVPHFLNLGFACSVTAMLGAGPAYAQQTASDGGGVLGGRGAAAAALVRASHAARAPIIDGDVLGDPAYEDALVASGFSQNRPDEGQPASERTEVRIVYTDDTLYFGVVCYTRDPDTIIVADSRRDSQMNETDSFQIILDTFLDQQNGFVFGTNPAGIEYDGQVSNEGQGSGRMGGGGAGGGSQQQGGSGGGFNLNWDGAWQVEARVTEIGWTAEFGIPFRTLRYPGGSAQTWGVNFQRNIRHRNERAFWAPLPRQFNLNRLSLAGLLQGLEVPSQGNLKLTPYVLGEAVRSATRSKTINTGNFGADLKYSITPGMTLDLTANTDFAQVEVDEEQINLDRFNLFFPEKRPFFLENAGLFSVGRPGQVEVFFSRRIGIGEEGQQVPIVGGGRLSGKVGDNTNIGFLNMQTAAQGDAVAGQNFTVARIRQDLPSRSNIGAIIVNRQGVGELAGDSNYNRTYAVDGRFGIGQSLTVSGFAADTASPRELGVGNQTHAAYMSSDFETQNVRLGLRYAEVGSDFNPEVGFYQRRGYRRAEATVFTFFRPDNFIGIHELRPHVNHFTVWNIQTGFHETQYTHMDNHWEWENGYEAHTGINLTKEGLFVPFDIFPGVVVPIGEYAHTESQLTFNTNRGAPVSAAIRSTIGGFFGGNRVREVFDVAVRLGETLNAQFIWDWNNIDLPGGNFTTNLSSLRVSYSFTTRVFLQALVQYNDRADLWSSNVRFGLLSDANTGLFVVYNDIQGLGTLDPHLDIDRSAFGRTLTIKYSQLFDLLN